jgi:hypothetical protein
VAHQQPTRTTTVAILGTNTAVNSALSLLLKSAGYDIRRIERDLPGLANGLLDGVDLLLLAPSLSSALREGILSAVRDNPTTAHTPVLTLSSAIAGGEALGHQSGPVVAWLSSIEELVRHIEAALRAGVDDDKPLAEGEAV